jgi:hypothetical protein
MKPKRLTQFTLSPLAALTLLVLLMLLLASHATVAWMVRAAPRPAANPPDQESGQTVLPAEKREKMHRLDPADIFDKSARARQPGSKQNRSESKQREERRDAARLNNRGKQRASEIQPGSTNSAQAASPATAPTPSPSPPSPETAPIQSLAAPASAAASAAKHPGWLLPLVFLLFLIVLGVLVLVVSKLTRMLRSTGT